MLSGYNICVISNFKCVDRLKKIDGNEYITRYQFLFNWCGFFELGMVARKYQKNWNKRGIQIVFKFIIVILWIVTGIVYCTFMTPSYWTYISMAYELLSIIAIYFIAEKLCETRFYNLIIDIGQNTYPIYFVHMQFGMASFGLIARILRISQIEWLLLVLKPITIVLGSWLSIKVISLFATKLHIRKVLWIFGIKG